ncbi:MAG: hypothetical protein DMF49_03345 [Acidobacteria bacterium]|nr:MAG: hypothetical protein DMF49_03345 [Acidobacteriota bacterium]
MSFSLSVSVSADVTSTPVRNRASLSGSSGYKMWLSRQKGKTAEAETVLVLGALASQEGE